MKLVVFGHLRDCCNIYPCSTYGIDSWFCMEHVQGVVKDIGFGLFFLYSSFFQWLWHTFCLSCWFRYEVCCRLILVANLPKKNLFFCSLLLFPSFWIQSHNVPLPTFLSSSVWKCLFNTTYTVQWGELGYLCELEQKFSESSPLRLLVKGRLVWIVIYCFVILGVAR